MSEENKEIIQNEEVEEVSDKGIDSTLIVTLDSFKEYYGNNGIKGALKTAAVYTAIVSILLYLFRGTKDVVEVLYLIGIFACSIFAVNIVFYFISKLLVIPQQYEKNDINKLGIKLHIDNKGIKQSLNDNSYTLLWVQVVLMKETDKSFLIFANARSGMVISKDPFSATDIEYIRSVASQRVMQYQDKRKIG